MDANNTDDARSSKINIMGQMSWSERSNPFSSVRFVIETDLSPDECRDRLRQHVCRTVDGFLLTYAAPFGRKPPTFFGSVDDRSFSIRQHVRSSTLGAGRPDHVVATGVFALNQRGKRVDITCAMSIYARILLAGWLIAGAIGGILAVGLLATNGLSAPAVLAAALFGFSLLVGCYTCLLRSKAPRNEQQVITWIRDVLDGDVVSANEPP
jgi:hypothetical protein